MKFRRDINDENVKMELVSHHRTTCSSRISSKKRFKPVRSSVKLMSKLYSQIEVNHSLKSSVGKNTLLDSTKNLSTINSLKVSINVNKVSRDFESKLSLNSDSCKKKELTSDNLFLSYKGYENPSFVLDSSLESSITEYLFEPLNDKKEKTDNCEAIKLPNGLPKQIENNFSVIADEQCNNQRSFSHKYTQQKGNHNENDNCKHLPINRKNSFSWKTQTNPKCYSQLIDDQHSEISTLISMFIFTHNCLYNINFFTQLHVRLKIFFVF